jgi:hypothetical protein
MTEIFGMIGWMNEIFGVIGWMTKNFGVIGWINAIFGVIGWMTEIFGVIGWRNDRRQAWCSSDLSPTPGNCFTKQTPHPWQTPTILTGTKK